MAPTASILVLQAYAADDPAGSPLGTFTKATDKWVQLEDNALGGGGFTINRHDAEADWATPGNYIRAYRDSVAGTLLGGFFIAGGGDTVLSPEEEGGEDLVRAGEGPIVVLREALVWHRAYAGGDGHIQLGRKRWHWDDAHPAKAMNRLLNEAQARGCIPFVTWDFSATLDSDGNAWSASAAKALNITIGLDLLEVVGEWQESGMHFRMDADFSLHAWDEYERDLSGGTVDFVAGVDLFDASEAQPRTRDRRSVALVEGSDDDSHRYRAARDGTLESALGRRMEGFVEWPRSTTKSVLERVGQRSIKRWKRWAEGPFTSGILESTGQEAVDDFLPGDTVGIDIAATGSERIASLMIRDRSEGAGEYDVLAEFGELSIDPQTGRDMGGGRAGMRDSDGSPSGGGPREPSGSIDPVANVTESLFEDWDRTVAPAAGNVVDIGSTPSHDTDGAPWDGNDPWSAGAGHSTVTVEVTGGRLHASYPGTTGRAFYPVILEGDGGLPNEGTWLIEDIETDALRALSGVSFRLSETGSGDQMEVGVRFGAGDIYTRWQAVGSDIDTAAFVYTVGVPYSVRWSVSATLLTARVWPTGDPEPTSWDVELVHAMIIPEGEIDLLLDGGNGGAQDIWVGPIRMRVAAQSGEHVESQLIALGDAVEVTFTLPSAPAAGSLTVYVDGLLTIPASIDVTAGTFTFSLAPSVGAFIVASWTVA